MSEEWLRSTSRPIKPADVDSSVPNPARVGNYLLGGRDNFAADRRAARQLLSATPLAVQAALASIAFRRRSVGYLAATAGICQFLDIGPGIPTAGSTHEVAQAANPACRVVYVDNDPVVLSHARARLRSPAEGATSYLDADASDTGAILAGASETLDLTRPVGVVLIGILIFVADAAAALGRLVAAMPGGSYLAVMQPAQDERLALAAMRWNQLSPAEVFLRGRDEIAGWFTGLELVDPGLVEVHQWQPAPGDPECPHGLPLLAGVARKP